MSKKELLKFSIMKFEKQYNVNKIDVNIFILGFTSAEMGMKWISSLHEFQVRYPLANLRDIENFRKGFEAYY